MYYIYKLDEIGIYWVLMYACIQKLNERKISVDALTLI